MHEQQNRLASELRNGEADRQEIVEQRAELTTKLQAAQSESQALARRLDSMTRESGQLAANAKLLESKVRESDAQSPRS